MRNRSLLLLLACLFVVMTGFGITLPVLPFFAERLALAERASQQAVAIHVGLLTAVYPMMQFVFAPLWGRWSDRVGRRPLVLVGIAGFAVAQALFGVASSLWLLYGARIVGGILSSATLPAVTAYVADVTSEEERSRGMAWQGTSVSLGVVVGPALGGVLSRRDLHFVVGQGRFHVDNFSIPFFAAAVLALLTLVVAIRWLPESLPVVHKPFQKSEPGGERRELLGKLWPLLGLTMAGQFGLAMFETTFALHAQRMLDYGPAEVGKAFTVCGLVMAVFQGGAVAWLAAHIRGVHQIAIGFILLGTGLVLLVVARRTSLVLSIVAWLALGMALIGPNLSALISKRGAGRTGTAVGLQNGANSLGQMAGPALGGLLFAWGMGAAYSLTGLLLVSIGIAVGLTVRRRR